MSQEVPSQTPKHGTEQKVNDTASAGVVEELETILQTSLQRISQQDSEILTLREQVCASGSDCPSVSCTSRFRMPCVVPSCMSSSSLYLPPRLTCPAAKDGLKIRSKVKCPKGATDEAHHGIYSRCSYKGTLSYSQSNHSQHAVCDYAPSMLTFVVTSKATFSRSSSPSSPKLFSQRNSNQDGIQTLTNWIDQRPKSATPAQPPKSARRPPSGGRSQKGALRPATARARPASARAPGMRSAGNKVGGNHSSSPKVDYSDLLRPVSMSLKSSFPLSTDAPTLP